MTATRILPLVLAGGAALALSCGDPSRPPAPGADLIVPPRWATALLECSPLPYASDTQTIGPEGGTLHVGPHTLSVPPGALAAPVTITAVAPSDTVNRVHFEPAGLVFERPASLTMTYANCPLLWGVLPKRIAFVGDDLRILEYLLSVDNRPSQTVTGRVEHFSDYAVAW